jgi:membrane dipeptidase
MRRREFLSAASLVAAEAALPPHIQRPRELALAALGATPNQIQHGLELHADSLVIEPYGFSPRSAPDGDALRRAIEAGASDVEVQDLTEEMRMTRHVNDEAERAEYRLAWKAAGVTCIFQNAGQEGQDPLRLLKRLARFTYTTDMLSDFVSRVVRPADIIAARQRGGHCLAMGLCGVPLTQQWVSVEDELRYIRLFFQLGVRMMHLTYNRRNMIGDGCGEAANAGLSDFGRAVVAEMNRTGVIVDVAHAGWRTSLEAAKASRKPVVASHSCCAALHSHIRSKPDEVIRAIVDTGGLIGICAVGHFLGRTGDIRAVLDHVDYVAKKFGADSVAIATDLAYNSTRTSEEFRKIPRGQRKRAEWEALWPGDSYPYSAPSSPTLTWTNWPLFTVGLVQRGYSDSDIRKILGGNVMRVFTAAMAG